MDQVHGLAGMMMMGQQLDLMMVEISPNFNEFIIRQKKACFNFWLLTRIVFILLLQ